jgi:hypothetical protein
MDWTTLIIGGVIGAVLGAVIGIPVFILTGHWGNRMTQKKDRESFEAKVNVFIDGLNKNFFNWIDKPPSGEEEVAQRRENVKNQVTELSQSIFGTAIPELPTFRPDITGYPELPCKWCHRGHEAFPGPQGRCRRCALPLDLWFGAQGQHKRIP